MSKRLDTLNRGASSKQACLNRRERIKLGWLSMFWTHISWVLQERFNVPNRDASTTALVLALIGRRRWKCDGSRCCLNSSRKVFHCNTKELEEVHIYRSMYICITIYVCNLVLSALVTVLSLINAVIIHFVKFPTTLGKCYNKNYSMCPENIEHIAKCKTKIKIFVICLSVIYHAYSIYSEVANYRYNTKNQILTPWKHS
jgi:hypothetical protein